MATIDSQYQVTIGGSDFSDVIARDGGTEWSVNSFSAESATGQDTTGYFHIPVLGELIQLVYTCPPYITKQRLNELVTALQMGSTGQRSININYNDPLFGQITESFYCTNIPWLKSKLPEYPYHYGGEVKFQLASVGFVKRSVVTDAPKIAPVFQLDPEYWFKINGSEFNDIIDISGYRGQIIEQSLESQTGRLLNGTMEIPIIGSRTQLDIDCVEYMEIGRFRQLGKALGFGKVGERSHEVTYQDMVMGATTQKFYCTKISGERVKLPNYPYDYIRNVKFQQAMKQFF